MLVLYTMFYYYIYTNFCILFSFFYFFCRYRHSKARPNNQLFFYYSFSLLRFVSLGGPRLVSISRVIIVSVLQCGPSLGLYTIAVLWGTIIARMKQEEIQKESTIIDNNKININNSNKHSTFEPY